MGLISRSRSAVEQLPIRIQTTFGGAFERKAKLLKVSVLRHDGQMVLGGIRPHHRIIGTLETELSHVRNQNPEIPQQVA